MKKICLFVTIGLCSWLGWKLGASWGIMTAYWISFFGSLLGVYLGCFINRRFLDYWLFRTRYEITWPFPSISLRILMPFRGQLWPCLFLTTALICFYCSLG